MITEHKVSIQNVGMLDSGVLMVSIPFSINEKTKITVEHDHTGLTVIPVIGSFKTIKVIWNTSAIKPIYSVNLKIERLIQ